MNLKELQEMIKEELDIYMNEEEVDVDVDMDAGDIDAGGAEKGDTDEDILMQIYNMLKDKFEGEEEMDMDDEEAEEEDADLSEESIDEATEEIEEATEEIEEAKDEDLDEGKKDDEDMKEEISAETTHLQERFKKLANIIK